MPALPIPEVPPPGTPDSPGRKPRPASVREPRREPTARPASATVRLCLVDPAADADEIVTAAVTMITTTYTAPGERIMLAEPRIPTAASRERRDRLVESVLRLGRGATTAPDHRPPDDHESSATGVGPPGTPGSGSGPGPQSGDAAEPVANPTDRQHFGEPAGPGSDGFRLIIAGWSDHPADPFAMADWTPLLAPSGTVLTHSNDQHKARVAHSGQLSRAAALAGLILTDQLILAHQPPSPPRPATWQSRRTIAFGGHRRIHTTASLFRRSTLRPEARHA